MKLSLLTWFKSHVSVVTKQDLIQLEKRIIMEIEEATKVLNELSTAADSLSLKVDKLETATTELIKVIRRGGKMSPEMEAAIAKAQAATTNAAREGDEVDAAVAAADEVLPVPAPAGKE